MNLFRLVICLGALASASILCAQTADAYFQAGMALAKQQQWTAAIHVFEEGRKKAPDDARFPLEIAGIAFHQGRYDEARRSLRNALKLQPRDEYALQFLGTVYLLQGNTDAALVCWNEINRPFVETVKLNGALSVRAELLDRAFAVSFAAQLKLSDYQKTKDALESLEIFPRYTLQLAARPEQNFDLIFSAVERDGFGNNRIDSLISLLRGLPYQTVNLEYYNWNHSAINILSLGRWDADRRRFWTSISAPLQLNPKLRLRVNVDARNEVWKPAPFENDFKLQTAESGFSLESLLDHRLKSINSLSFSHRSFVNASFESGNALEYTGALKHRMEFPQTGLRSDSSLRLNAGRFLNRPDRFLRLEFSTIWSTDWMQTGLRAGTSAGDLPFDRLYVLGIDRDDDLLLRAHTNLTGKKGSLPIGRKFVLLNWEANQTVFRNPLFQWSLGPFLDTGKVYGSPSFFASKWLVDSGIQLKLRVLHSITAGFVYGRDLRSGKDSFYINITR